MFEQLSKKQNLPSFASYRSLTPLARKEMSHASYFFLQLFEPQNHRPDHKRAPFCRLAKLQATSN